MPLPFKAIGSIPAAILPFFEDFSIDEASFRAHLTDLANSACAGSVCPAARLRDQKTA